MMEMYREGYETYRQACEQFGMESMNYYLYIKNLTPDQLNAFNEHKKGSGQIANVS